MLGVHPNTVREWIRRGMQTCDDRRPTLVQGADLIEFLKSRRQKNRVKSPAGHIFCVRCRGVKSPAGKMVDYVATSPALGNLVGICPDCSGLIFRRVNPAKLRSVCADLDVRLPKGVRHVVHFYLAGLLVSADPARAKLLALKEAGIGLKQAAKLAGLARSTVQLIRAGQVTTISRDTATAILAIQKPYLAHGQKVSAWRAKRILRALKDEQFTKTAIAKKAGLTPQQLSSEYFLRDDSRISVATHLKILRVWMAVSDEAMQ